ncbi:MAG: SAM-dependent methyltransferase, partial [Roseimicrobium sp.]
MDRALHGNEGYYAARVHSVGRTGDFATAASVSSALGEAVASWLDQELRQWPDVRTVIEVGGGDGLLSHAALSAIGWWKRQRLRWCMVETSPTLRAQQQARLGSRAHWFDTLPAAMMACQGKALLFHNELVDAFPVRLLQWSASKHSWDEVWLEQISGGWFERLEPAVISLAERQTHRALCSDHWTTTPLRDGQRVELPAAYCRWLHSWAPAWRLGSMLTVDYGDAFPNLYYRRPRGTVRGYLRHQTL